jgi:hypothetical protein
MTLLAALFALTGMLCLALGMERHQGGLLKHRLSRQGRRRAQILAWAALASAYVVAAVGYGPAMGAVLWVGLLSLGAMIVLLTLSW